MSDNRGVQAGSNNTAMMTLGFAAIVGLIFALAFFFNTIHSISKPRTDSIQAQLTDALSPTIVALSLKDGEYVVMFNQILYVEANKGPMGAQFFEEPCGANLPEVKLQVVKGRLAEVVTSEALLSNVDKASAVDCINRSLHKITPRLYESAEDSRRADEQQHQQTEKAKKSWGQ